MWTKFVFLLFLVPSAQIYFLCFCNKGSYLSSLPLVPVIIKCITLCHSGEERACSRMFGVMCRYKNYLWLFDFSGSIFICLYHIETYVILLKGVFWRQNPCSFHFGICRALHKTQYRVATQYMFVELANYLSIFSSKALSMVFIHNKYSMCLFLFCESQNHLYVNCFSIPEN